LFIWSVTHLPKSLFLSFSTRGGGGEGGAPCAHVDGHRKLHARRLGKLPTSRS